MRSDSTRRRKLVILLAPVPLIFVVACLWAVLASSSKPTATSSNKDEAGAPPTSTRPSSTPPAQTGFRLEYVVPMKKITLSDQHSPPEALRRHDSGHFRQRMADVWDPHPEYQFTAFNRTFHLVLQLAPSFVVPNLQVTHIWQNMSVQEEPDLKPDGCFYTGTVLGDPRSSVTVNLCHGMRGHIRTSDGSYFIEPAEPFTHFSRPIKHQVFSMPVPLGHSCSRTGTEERIKAEGARRRKRSLSQEYFIELMVVADRKMAEYHGAELKSYILTLMAMVTQIFKDASLGNLMSLAVVKMYVLKDVDMTGGRSYDPYRKNEEEGVYASEMLKRFCDWQKLRNDEEDASPNHHDTAILLTREPICSAISKDKENGTMMNCRILGLAEVGTMCTSSSCSLVRDNGLSAAFTIAHELGHVLNMPHDDDHKCRAFIGYYNMHNIMARSLDNKTNPWSWSNCSRHFLTEYLDAGKGSCLLDPPELNILDERRGKSHLPGEDFTDARQCELIHGKGSRSCSYMPVCKQLWCTAQDAQRQEVCVTHLMPWADGTPCGHYSNNIALWCQRGECVPRDRRALQPVNGGWGNWQPYGECSRTCGGGVKQAVRNCDRPRPANGGRYCVGRRVKYKSCSTKECPHGSIDFRELQCARFNNENITIQGHPRVERWVAEYDKIRKEDRCRLYCRVADSDSHFLLKEKVIDGTPCGRDTYDICVNGVCNSAGCDHILNSPAELDFCGQCGGNNSTCQVISGSYNESQYGYSTVVRIPAGSSNLDIRQTGYMNLKKDENYLVLVDSDTRRYILNGDYSVSKERKDIPYGNTTLEYTGSDAVVERVNSSRPLTKDLVVMVLSVGNLYPPNIVYQYTVQKSTLAQYSWELSSAWRACDKVCNGESHKDIICIRVDGGEKVAPEMCEGLEKPQSPAKPCNLHCILKWEVTSLSECSSHCGPGVRYLTAQCVQVILTTTPRRIPIDNSSCTHLPTPPSTEECTGPCDEARWNFTQWGPCSQTCGEGVQQRTAFCVDEMNRPRNESDCRLSEKKIIRVCRLQKCPQWVFGEWTNCSVTCGTGKRNRPYWCHEGNLVVSNSRCSNQPVPRYLTEETCTLDPCPTWITHDWSLCSVTCGSGAQMRLVECSVPEGCSEANKPHTARSCEMHPCSLRHENASPDIDNHSVHRFTWKPKPWGYCSVTCGEGVSWREAECFDEKYYKVTDPQECLSQSIPIKRIKKCVILPKCPSWEVGLWGPCSAICDQGIETREVRCTDYSGKEVDERNCDGQKPGGERVCTAANPCNGPKDTWKTSPMSQCSVSCGGGYRTRKVECESGRCAEPRPSTSEPCNSHPCIKAYWKYGNWSQCNTTCGPGSRFRHVHCRSVTGMNLPDIYCSSEAKPRSVQTCPHNRPCSKYVRYDWQHSRHWSQCSKTCGKGVRRREVWCAMSSGDRVADWYCVGTRRPKSVKECKRADCPFDWATQPWSQCSVSCGRGVQTRAVHCYGYRGFGQGAPSVVDSTYCSNSSKPATSQDCFNQHCSRNSRNFHWVAGPWQQCSEKCSRKGKQVRKLFCYNDRVKVRKINCPKARRPERRKKCQMEKCESCAQLQQSSNSRKDGEYMLQVGPSVLSIYCHSMNTPNPREYVTLHVPRENYAEVYDKRLEDINSCPNGGQRTEHCRCVRNTQRNVGFTVFKKIRVNLTTLIIDSTDWTFATVVRGGKVPYGEAGDCYSKASCPQGQFRINLEKTGFRISLKQVWHKYGLHASHKIDKFDDNKKVVGYCGGYCGMCKPHRGLKLDILPP